MKLPAILPRARRTWSFSTRLEAKRVQFAWTRMRGRLPVVTYATWRTASTSVHHAIRASSRAATVKAHSLHRANTGVEWMSALTAASRPGTHVGDWAVHRYVVSANRRADWVVLVRDPLAMAMSMAAHGVQHSPSAEVAAHRVDEAILRAPVGCLDWWLEEDMRPALGWCALDEPFDRERGWTSTECSHGRVLVLRADVPDERKGEALSRFLGTRVLVTPKNDARSGGRGGALAAIAARLAAHPQVIAASLAQGSARHFWREDQLLALRSRWLPAA
ncbi:MAG: hypothetical protein FGM39_04985 [Phycisphaerales bacterium]|nr:hypothetical protein [Phycisphaerales bacterium]